jgi:hypothetical protein
MPEDHFIILKWASLSVMLHPVSGLGSKKKKTRKSITLFCHSEAHQLLQSQSLLNVNLWSLYEVERISRSRRGQLPNNSL